METTTANVATDVLRVDVPEQFIALFGIREENMRLFREELDVDIYAHGGEVTFTGDADKDAAFVKAATAAGFVNLKGHRTVGGMRASIYNAMPIEGIEKLVAFMKQFEVENK